MKWNGMKSERPKKTVGIKFVGPDTVQMSDFVSPAPVGSLWDEFAIPDIYHEI